MRKLTFSERRRFISFLRQLAENAFLPFLFGVVLAFILTSSATFEALMSIDKAGFDLCVKSQGRGGNQ